MTPKQQRFVGYYVYALVDPRTDTAFYIGKGIRRRHLDHAKQVTKGTHPNPFIVERVQNIRDAGYEVQSICLMDQLPEWQALLAERELIQKVGVERLANQSHGGAHWAHKAMMSAAVLLKKARRLPMGINDALRTAIIERCAAISQGRCLIPPEVTNGEYAKVLAYWNGSWLKSNQSIKAGYGTA